MIPAFVAASLSLLAGPIVAAEAPAPIKKEKLQIVFCFGQSNMVGLASKDNGFNVNDAYEELVNRDKEIAGAVDRVRGIYVCFQ